MGVEGGGGVLVDSCNIAPSTHSHPCNRSVRAGVLVCISQLHLCVVLVGCVRMCGVCVRVCVCVLCVCVCVCVCVCDYLYLIGHCIDISGWHGSLWDW